MLIVITSIMVPSIDNLCFEPDFAISGIATMSAVK